MDGFIESTVNAEPVVNVEPQTEVQETTNTEPVNAGSEEVASPQVDSKPVQTPEQNAYYADIRRKAAQEAQDKLIAEMYGESHGIYTKAQYDEAVRAAQEAERKAQIEQAGIDEELINKIINDNPTVKQANEIIAREQQRQQEERVKAVEKEANELVTKAKEEGFEITVQQLAECVNKSGVASLSDAYKLLKADVDIKTIKENAIKEYIEARKAGKIPVEGSGTAPIVASEPPKDFNSAKEGALAMLRASKLFKNN